MKKMLWPVKALFLLFMGCDMFNTPIDPFIREHTAEVTVASLDLTNAVWQPDKNGYLTSGPDVEINVVINNPAGIELVFTAACFINGAEEPANLPGGRFGYKKTSNYRVQIKISGITTTPGEQIHIKLGMQTADGLRTFSPYNCPPIATNLALLEEIAVTGGITYPSLSAALDAAAAGTESNPAAVRLLKNTDFPETGAAAYTISAKHIKLISDGGVHTITHKTGHTGSLFEVSGGSLVLENITIAGNGSDGNSAIKVSSKLTMGVNAAVKNFAASSNGGAVYIDGGTFTMEGGSITGNTATLGSGVFVDGTFTMSGAARITGNDVYLSGNNTIKVGGTFSPIPAGIAATISLPSYAVDIQVLSESSPGLMTSEHDWFAVTDSTYHVNSSGKLATWTYPGDVNGTVPGTPGNDYISVGGSINSGGAINAGEGNNTVTVGQDINGGTITAGSGTDSITVEGNMYGGFIYAGGGDDAIEIKGIINSYAVIDAGPGNDTVSIGKFDGFLTIDLGSDSDTDAVYIYSSGGGILTITSFDTAHDKLHLPAATGIPVVNGGNIEISLPGWGKVILTGVSDTNYGSYILKDLP
ncbi:MAG: hypothetical protein LBK74_05900 [Treponema sp.]|nr:hypothetical protein [Treponema sp.]